MNTDIYEVAYFSDCGKVRTLNEDSYLIQQKNIGGESMVLAAIADGMGGLCNGQQASQMVIASLQEWWEHELPDLLNEKASLAALESSLEDYIHCAHQQILQSEGKMGTTLSLVFLKGNQYLVKHAGDSRIYFYRDIGLEQITRDQTWYEQERERGFLQVYDIPEKKMRSVLVNALGVKQDYFLEAACGDLKNVQTIVLCSDGVYQYVSQTMFETILQKRSVSAHRKIRKMETILKQSEACDNYTAIIIQKKKRRCQFANFCRIR